MRRAVADNTVAYRVTEIEPTTEGVSIDPAYIDALLEDALDEPGIVLAGMLYARLMDGRHRAAKALQLGRKTMRAVVVDWTAYPTFIVED